MFFNKSNFDIIGGFDENFFLYFEETDFCLRARKLNLFSYQLNEIKLTHNVGTSISFDNESEKEKLKIYIFGILYGRNFIFIKNIKDSFFQLFTFHLY